MATFQRLTRAIRDFRTWLWLAALVLGCVASFRANATGYDFGNNQYAAYQQCQAHAAGDSHDCTGPHSDGGGTYYQLILDGGGYNIYVFTGGITTCTPPAVLSSGDVCSTPGPTAEQCAERAPYAGSWAPEGSIQCDPVNPGCFFEAVSSNGDTFWTPYLASEGVGLTCNNSALGGGNSGCPSGWRNLSGTDWSGLQNLCLPPDEDSDGDGVPNDEDETPTEFGNEPRDTDGDGIPDIRDAMPNDPENGEGEDGEADNTSTGGGDCNSAPQSSGDGLLSMIAFQTWKTRCAAERTAKALGNGINVNVSGGGSGDGETVTFDEVVAGIPDEGVTAEDAWGEPGEGGLSGGFNDTGFLSEPRTCPDLPSFTMPEFFGGYEFDLDEAFTGFCTLMYYGGLFIWLMAALASIKIYMKVFE